MFLHPWGFLCFLISSLPSYALPISLPLRSLFLTLSPLPSIPLFFITLSSPLLSSLSKSSLYLCYLSLFSPLSSLSRSLLPLLAFRPLYLCPPNSCSHPSACILSDHLNSSFLLLFSLPLFFLPLSLIMSSVPFQ